MLLDLESFNGFTTGFLGNRFTSVLSGAAYSLAAPEIGPYGLRGNACLRLVTPFYSANDYGLRMTVTPGDKTFNIGWRQKWAGPFSGVVVDYNNGFGDIRNNYLFVCPLSGNSQFFVRVLADGRIDVVRGSLNQGVGNGAGTVLGTSSKALTPNAWQSVRCKGFIDPSSGTVKVVVDGITFLDLTGVNTQSRGAGTGWSEWWTPNPNCSGSAITLDIMDVYVSDGVSGDGWTDIRPSLRVGPRLVTGQGSKTDSTPKTGSNRADMVKEGSNTGGTGPDSDTTYNTFAAANDEDSYTHQGPDVSGGTVLGMALKAFAKAGDGAALLKLGLRTGGSSTYPGADLGPASSYKYLSEMFGRDPIAAAAWTESNFNAYEWAIKKTL